MDFIEGKRDREEGGSSSSEDEFTRMKKPKTNLFTFVSSWAEYDETLNMSLIFNLYKVDNPRDSNFQGEIQLIADEVNKYINKPDVKYIENWLTSVNSEENDSIAFIVKDENQKIKTFSIVRIFENELNTNTLIAKATFSNILKKVKLNPDEITIINFTKDIINIKKEFIKTGKTAGLLKQIKEKIEQYFTTLDSKEVKEVANSIKKYKLLQKKELSKYNLLSYYRYLCTIEFVYNKNDIDDNLFTIRTIQSIARSIRSELAADVLFNTIPINAQEERLFTEKLSMQSFSNQISPSFDDYMYYSSDEASGSITFDDNNTSFQKGLEQEAYDIVHKWKARKSKTEQEEIEYFIIVVKSKAHPSVDYAFRDATNFCRRKITVGNTSKFDAHLINEAAFDQYRVYKEGNDFKTILAFIVERNQVCGLIMYQPYEEYQKIYPYDFQLTDSIYDLLSSLNLDLKVTDVEKSSNINSAKKLRDDVEKLRNKYLKRKTKWTKSDIESNENAWKDCKKEMFSIIKNYQGKLFITGPEIKNEDEEKKAIQELCIRLLKSNFGSIVNIEKNNFVFYLALICADESRSGSGISKQSFSFIQKTLRETVERERKRGKIFENAYIALTPDSVYDPSPIYRYYGLSNLYDIEIEGRAPLKMLSKNLLVESLNV